MIAVRGSCCCEVSGCCKGCGCCKRKWLSDRVVVVVGVVVVGGRVGMPVVCDDVVGLCAMMAIELDRSAHDACCNPLPGSWIPMFFWKRSQ